MKNLKLLLNLKIHSEIFLDTSLIISGQITQDNDLNSKLNNVFVISNDCLYSVDLITDKKYKIYDLKNLFPEEDVPRAISMWYRDLYNMIFICFESGSIFSLILDNNNGVQHSRNNHCLETNVSQIQWSPDEELAIVITHQDKLILLNSEFFTLSEIDLNDKSLGENELINVGWGKKETQFHGSEGKNAAVSKPSVINPSMVEDSHSVQVTWRGDSNLFAVSYWCIQNSFRKVKIYNNDGVLQSISEDIRDLNEPICWKPSGNLITLPQQLPNKKVISFLEKNGLKHGDFTLPDDVKVKHVTWNEASTILCTVCKNLSNHEEEVILWTVGNQHWYLKQKFKFIASSHAIWWDRERPNRIYALCEGGILQILEWTFTVNSSYNSNYEENSYVGVIDNDSILLTSFKEAVVPPPMSSYKLKCSDSVNHLLFAPKEQQGLFMLCAVLYNGDLAFFKDPMSEAVIFSDLVQKNNFTIEAISLSHWEWVSSDTLAFFHSVQHGTNIHELNINGETLKLRNTLNLNGNIITCNKSSDNIIIQRTDGKLFTYNIKSAKIIENFSLIEPCHDIKVHSAGLFCLSELSRLYLNDTPFNLPSIIGKVTSFIIKDPYILVTSSSHKLIILQYNNSETIEISDRKIERGSKLVVTSGNSVILQAPRGNLETIQPRALTILTLGKLIDSKDYKSALSLMRKQRINLSLLVDHNQRRFIEEAKNFVDEVDPQWITLLITELSPEDVSETLYKLYYKSKEPPFLKNDVRVTVICNTLLSAMSKSDESRKRYILPSLSGLVKINEMGKAIKIAGNEQALQHLMFIVDPDKLYLEALGTYDLNAALKIAEKSQRDPKEYIPYLNSLKSMEPDYMKFTIDKTLKRSFSGLLNICKCNGREDECLSYIEENLLYAEALNIYKKKSERYPVIALKYAEYLFKQRKYEESALMFLRAGNKEKAVHSFTRAGNWKQCMVTLMDPDFSAEEQSNLARNVCNMLISAHKYAEAATFYMDWLKDIDKAIEMYVQGRCWMEAMYVAKKFSRLSLIDKFIKDSLVDTANILGDEINENMTKTVNYIERLKQVRIEKENRSAYVFDDMSDTASDTSSTTSARTKSSQSQASRNTKKINRKMWSLKEGNPREEEALIATLSEMIKSTEKCVDEVNLTCSTLIMLGEDKVATRLQSLMADWLSISNRYKTTIWPKDPEMNEAAVLDQKFKFPPETNIKSDWDFQVIKLLPHH